MTIGPCNKCEFAEDVKIKSRNGFKCFRFPSTLQKSGHIDNPVNKCGEFKLKSKIDEIKDTVIESKNTSESKSTIDDPVVTVTEGKVLKGKIKE